MATMTGEQKYNELLKELGEVLYLKNATIDWQEFQIKNLQEKLERAEAELKATQDKLSELRTPVQDVGTVENGGAA